MLTAPLVTVKLVLLNEAIPLAEVEALSIVTVEPVPLAFARLIVPFKPFKEFTTLPLAAKPQAALLCRQTVPLAFGKLIALLVVGVTKLTVVVKPLSVALIWVEPLP